MKLPDWGTVLAILLASDKTNLTTFSGGKMAYPCYLSLGNISKAARSLQYLKAWPLVAYWPVLTKGVLAKAGIKFKNREHFQQLKRDILHCSVRIILDEIGKKSDE